MRIAVVHGYFLGDSGSAIYTRELAREFTRQGHEVTLVCQEQHPDDYTFIDSLYDFGPGNTEPHAIFEREHIYQGSCRLVRPHIGGRILTYVAGPFPPFEAMPFQDAPDDWIARYADANVKALETIFKCWPPELVQANHAVLQPWLVLKALARKAPYIVTIHGSELNFTVRKDSRMVPYMVEGLAGALSVAALSKTSRDEAIGLAAVNQLDIAAKTVIIPPGVDTELFTPDADTSQALKEVSSAIDPDLDEIAVFAGRLLWTKGLQYVIAALPFILQQHPRLRLIVVGEGPMRKYLERLIDALERGAIKEARDLVINRQELRSVPEYGSVIPEMTPEEEKVYKVSALGDLGGRIHFTGHLPHERLAPILAAADISLAPSVFPEAFGLVSIEALAAGALPVATYQTGLRSPLDVVSRVLGDTQLKELAPGCVLTRALASAVNAILERYPTRDMDFRRKLWKIAEDEFSWAVVAQNYLAEAGGNSPQA